MDLAKRGLGCATEGGEAVDIALDSKIGKEVDVGCWGFVEGVGGGDGDGEDGHVDEFA